MSASGKLTPWKLTIAWPELLALARVAQRLLERALGEAERQRRDADAPGVERLMKLTKPSPSVAEQVLGRHLDVLEDQLGGVGRAPAELVLLLARPEAGRASAATRRADAEPRTLSRSAVSFVRMNELMPSFPPRVGHRGHDEHLADRRVRDEPLAAVEHVVPFCGTAVVRVPPASLPGVGLGEAEPAQHAAAGEQRDVALALLLVAEVVDRRGAERRVRGDRDRVRRVDLGHLVDGDDVARQVQPGAAHLLGPRHAEEAELAHALDVLPGELRDLVVVGRDGRDLALGEAADHVAHGDVLVGEVEAVVHGCGARAPVS
jgi:hypothetical protein